VRYHSWPARLRFYPYLIDKAEVDGGVNTSCEVMRRSKAMSQGAAKTHVALRQIRSLLLCFSIRVAYVYNPGVGSHGGEMKQAWFNDHHHDT
jgi:hypothetical protein